MGSAPDYVEPILGWRSWLVVADGQQMRLSSVIYPTLWPARRELVASCRHRPRLLLRPWRRRPSEHSAPEARCRCGIYGTADPEKAAPYLAGRVSPSEPPRSPLLHRVIGRVLLWGAVVECEHGWRASHAYPERLYVPSLHDECEPGCETSEVAGRLSAYGVATEVLECATHEEVAAVLADEFPLAADAPR